MSAWVQQLLNGDFMPHGHCLLWRPDLLAMNVIPDLIIALSYFVIPFALIYLIKKRTDLEFDWIFVMFSLFIFACGTTHIFEVINIWHGYYYAEALIKTITAIASIITAVMIWPLIPKILAIPSNALLSAKNRELKETQSQLENMNALLEQKVLERTAELQKSNTELDSFAYAASHDLKEPLRGICNYSGFLLEDYGDKLDEEGRNKLETLIQLSKRLDRLISSLLEYSREARMELTKQTVDLNEALQSALEPLQIRTDDPNLNLIRAKALPVIKCDRIQIEQVFSNLVSNALKYNDKKSQRIEIGTCTKSELVKNSDPEISSDIKDRINENDAILFVRDNGIGIDVKHYDSVFRMFKRLHGRDDYGGGAGIGLAMVKKIIERHKGLIWIESLPGIGTTVYFSLPSDDSITL